MAKRKPKAPLPELPMARRYELVWPPSSGRPAPANFPARPIELASHEGKLGLREDIDAAFESAAMANQMHIQPAAGKVLLDIRDRLRKVLSDLDRVLP